MFPCYPLWLSSNPLSSNSVCSLLPLFSWCSISPSFALSSPSPFLVVEFSLALLNGYFIPNLTTSSFLSRSNPANFLFSLDFYVHGLLSPPCTPLHLLSFPPSAPLFLSLSQYLFFYLQNKARMLCSLTFTHVLALFSLTRSFAFSILLVVVSSC